MNHAKYRLYNLTWTFKSICPCFRCKAARISLQIVRTAKRAGNTDTCQKDAPLTRTAVKTDDEDKKQKTQDANEKPEKADQQARPPRQKEQPKHPNPHQKWQVKKQKQNLQLQKNK